MVLLRFLRERLDLPAWAISRILTPHSRDAVWQKCRRLGICPDPRIDQRAEMARALARRCLAANILAAQNEAAHAPMFLPPMQEFLP